MSPTFVLITVLFPLIFMAAFAGGLSPLYQVPTFDYDAGYTAFVYGFVVLQAAAFGGIFTGYATARDFEIGFAPRLFLAARSRGALILGYLLVAVVRSLIAAALVTLAAWVGGMDAHGSLEGYAVVTLLVVLVAVATALWACGVAMRVRKLRGGPLMHTPILLMVFLAPVYLPLPLLGGWLEAVAGINPFTYIIETVRGVLDGKTEHMALTFAMSFGWIGALSIWAMRGLRQAEEAL